MGKVKEALKKHLVDSTAMIVAAHPIAAPYEKFMAGMTNAVAIKSRLVVTGIGYLGMASVFTKGRDLSRKYFNITDESRAGVQALHDIGYNMAFNAVAMPPIYYVSGARDWKEVAIGTGMTVGLSFFSGWVIGYTVDLYRDLLGIEESKRIPEVIRRQPARIKKGLAGLVTAASLGLLVGIYSLPSYNGGEVIKDKAVETYERAVEGLEHITGF
ncbi:MAG: L-alanine exporter AlaE [archaeon]